MRADDELLAAYCDGVTELTLDERKRVEALLAEDAGLRGDEVATRELLGALRELPAEGTEPDWLAMERAIRAEVGPDVPRAWWRAVLARWRWLVPLAATATVAMIAVIALPRDAVHETAPRDAGTLAAHDASPVEVLGHVATEEPAVVALALDGEAVVLDAADDELFEVDDVLLGEGDATMPGLLTGDDLGWIDELDDEGAALADAWLDGRKKG